MPFSGMMVPVPAGYDKILTARYGEKYMDIPPAWKQKRRHNVYFVPDKPWYELDRFAVIEELRRMNDLSLKV